MCILKVYRLRQDRGPNQNKQQSRRIEYYLLSRERIRKVEMTSQITQKQMEENLMFGDWVSIESEPHSAIGHLGNTGIGVEIIKDKQQLKSFAFFQIVPSKIQIKHILTYSSKCYLRHVQSGLYLSSLLHTDNQTAIFINLTLTPTKQQSCLFMFHKSSIRFISKTQKHLYTQRQYIETDPLNIETQPILIGSNVRIVNCLSDKYLQVAKTQQIIELKDKAQEKSWTGQVQYEAAKLKAKQLQSNGSKIKDRESTGKKRESDPNMKHQRVDKAGNNIWLSSNSDVFTLKLERRQRIYNPVLLSNYDVVLIYNQFTRSYLTISKRKHLLNMNRYNQEETPTMNTKSMGEAKITQSSAPFSIQLNPNYFSPKNCFVQQTPDHMFQNKDSFLYLWKVFSIPVDNKQRITDAIAYPSLIKSKSIIYFQHLQTGLFLIKNQNQNQSSDEYILRNHFQEPDGDQNSEKNIFMFRIQNLNGLRYEKKLIFNEQVRDSIKNEINHNFISTEFQPVNSSLHVTLDFQEQQFMISKLQSYPRIHYFSYHFPSFLKLLISFLNNPKAIDDRTSLLKQKLTIMEMIYDPIFSQGFSQIVKQIDRGFYFLSKTITLLKIIRIKIKYYQLEAEKIKVNLQIIQQTKKYQTSQTNQRKRTDFDPYGEYYLFSNNRQPFEQLQQIIEIVLSLLRPLIVKILRFLALVFGDQSREIFDMIVDKEVIDEGKVHDIKKMSEGVNEKSLNEQTIIKKKNTTIMSTSLAKKRLRNNSGSSFKSSSSSISEGTWMRKQQGMNVKSAFAGQVQNQRKQGSSQIITELIKSLVSLLEVEPEGCSEILKLLSVKQPYEIIGQLNDKLEKLQEKINELEQTTTRNNPHNEPSTTLKTYKHLENIIFTQMHHCLKLINHILQYFHQDLQYDWSKKLRYIETNFQIKIQFTKDNKIQTHHPVKKDAQIVIHYRKRWFKLSQILTKTQNPHFQKLFKLVKEEVYKKKSQSLTSLMKQPEKQSILKEYSDKSNSEKYLIEKQKRNHEKKFKLPEENVYPQRQNENNGRNKIKYLKRMFLVTEEKNNFFQFLKDIIKLMLINLKNTHLPVSQMLYFFDCGKIHGYGQTNALYQYTNLSSLNFVLEFINNIDITLIKGLASSQFLGNFDISLLTNCRFIFCDNEPISEKTDLFKILNFDSYQGNENQNCFNDYPLFLREENIQYLIEKSPFCAEFFQSIVSLFIERQQQQSSGMQSEKKLFIESISGLKTILISLQVFTSVGHWNFRIFKRIETYTLELCLIIAKYINVGKSKAKDDELDLEKGFHNFEDELISGVKDAIQSLLIEINELMQIIYIQKKRVIRYPHIIDSGNFFSDSYLSHKYKQSIRSNAYLVKQIPILTHLFQLTSSLSNFNSFSTFSQKENKQKAKNQTEHRLPGFPLCQFYPSNEQNMQQNSVFLTWPYLYFEEIQIFYPHEIQIQAVAFQRTSQTISKLNEVSLMLNTLESMQQNQKVKNHMVVEIRQKISQISTNLLSLPKIQANKKVISSFGLIEIILSIILNNRALQKVSIKPFLQFLIAINMWKVTAKDFYRVLVKGGLANHFQSHNQTSLAFLTKNIKKPQFFVITAKYLQQTQSSSDKQLIAQILTSNLIQLIDYHDHQPYQLLSQKLTFITLIIEKTNNQNINLKCFYKLMNRQDVKLYMEALRTLKNFQSFSQNIKNIKVFLQNKKTVNQKYFSQNFTNQSFVENSNPRNSSVFNLSTNIRSESKLKKVVVDMGNEDEMTTFKRQEITKFTMLTSVIFKIYNRIQSTIDYYLDNYLSLREILKIVKSNAPILCCSYQMLKPLFLYLQSNQIVYDPVDKNTFSFALSFSHIDLTKTIQRQNEILQHLMGLNEILMHYHLYTDQLETYQATSSFFLPFLDDHEHKDTQQLIQFNKEKIKKIASQLKNLNKKTYFWELLLWNPCYQQEEGVLVSIQKIILANLDLFVWRTYGKKRSPDKHKTQDILQRLQTPLNRTLQSVFDNILSIHSMLENFTTSRFIRLRTRLQKLKMIFTEIFPTIQSSLLKSLKIKEKQKQIENQVIEEDEDPLEFSSSDDKNIKSQVSSYERKESFSSLARKMKNVKIAKRTMNEPKTLQVKQGVIINKKQDGNQKFTVEMIGYQLTTKLWSYQKIQAFIKVFEEEEKRRQLQQQKLQICEKQFQKRQTPKINLIKNSNKLFAQIGDYLEDESEDHIVDEPQKQKKFQVPKNFHIGRSEQSNDILELRHIKSNSQLSDMRSFSDSANYSHHAMIIAQNSLNQDIPCRRMQTFNERSGPSSFGQDSEDGKGLKNFLMKGDYESMYTMKNLRRADYSHFSKGLRNYKFYEVTMLLKKVFLVSTSQKLEYLEDENEMYYQVQKLLLDFYSFNTNINSLFQNIQNYLKLQSQKAAQKQLDVNFCFDVSGIMRHHDEQRVLLNIIKDYSQQSQEIDDYGKGNIDWDILKNLMTKQNSTIIDKLLTIHIKFQNNSISSYRQQSFQFNQCLSFLNLLLRQNNNNEDVQLMRGVKLRKEIKPNKIKPNKNGVNGDRSIRMNKRNISRQSEQHSVRSQDKSLRTMQQCHWPSQSTITKTILSSNINTTQYNKQQSLNIHQFQDYFKQAQQFSTYKMNQVSILCNILKIFNHKTKLLIFSNKLHPAQLSPCLLNLAQEQVEKFIFKLIWNFHLINHSINTSQFLNSKSQIKQSILIIESRKFEIKFKFLQNLNEMISFMSFGKTKQKKSELKRSMQNFVGKLMEFSLGESCQQIMRTQNIFSNNNQSEDIQKPEVSLSSILLTREYFESMSGLVRNNEIQSQLYEKATINFSYKMIAGSIDKMIQSDLTSSNLKSLQLIRLMTSCLTFLQIFVSSTSSANLLTNTATHQTMLVYTINNKNQIHNSYLPFQLVLKLIRLEVFLYELLFNNHNEYFSCYSYSYYLHQMMRFNDANVGNSTSSTAQNSFDQEKEKTDKYIHLLHLFIESLNIFHNLFYKFQHFPQFQSNLFQQRKLFICHDQQLNKDIQRMKRMYSELDEIFKSVIVSTDKQKGKRKYEVVTFPFYKQFQFVWKFSLLKLSQSFLNQTQRMDLAFGASKVFLSQNFTLRNITYYIVKQAPLCSLISEVIIVLLILINLVTGHISEIRVINYILLTGNLGLIMFAAMERITSTVIMSLVVTINRKTNLLNAFIILFLVYFPLLFAIVANIYSYSETQAIPFILFICLFNRVQKFYESFHRNFKRIRSIVVFGFGSMMIILVFHFFTKLGLNTGLPDGGDYFTTQGGVFQIDGESFNFLNALFQLPAQTYITNPIIIIFYLWFCTIQILVIASIIISIGQKIKGSNLIDPKTGNEYECSLCSKNAQMLLEQYVKETTTQWGKVWEEIKKESFLQRRLKSYGFDRSEKYSGLIMSENLNVSSMLQFEKEQVMKEIILSHIKQRHNIFQYISYFCYLLDKKEVFMSEKQKKLRKMIEKNDYEVYL